MGANNANSSNSNNIDINTNSNITEEIKDNLSNNNDKNNTGLLRRNTIQMSQITSNIYLGNIYDAQNTNQLLKLEIQKVLSLITETQLLNYPSSIEHKLINVEDQPRQNIIQYFGECLSFIEDNKKILVHCFAGSSRSATIIIAYIMWKYQLNFLEAIKLVRQKRPSIDPNYGFIRQLQMFEEILKQNKYNLKTINFKGIQYPRFFHECCF